MSEINSGRLTSQAVRQNWREVVDYVHGKGNHVVVSRAGKPVVAVIPFEDFRALVDQLEDLYDVRAAERNIAEGVREGDPATLALIAREQAGELVA